MDNEIFFSLTAYQENVIRRLSRKHLTVAMFWDKCIWSTFNGMYAYEPFEIGKEQFDKALSIMPEDLQQILKQAGSDSLEFDY